MTNVEQDETRRRIIAAALTLFGNVGYTRATTRAIAEEAGVNEVTLFRHFGNKKNLLLEVSKAFNKTGFAETFRSHLTGDYAADIRIMAHLQMADITERFDMVRLLMCEASVVEELRDALAMGAGGNINLLANYFAEQITSGIVRSELDPNALAYVFGSLFSSHAMSERMMGTAVMPGIDQKILAEALADLFIRGTIAEPAR